MEISKGNKIALVLGSTGLVGSHLLDYLLASPAYARVICFVRRPLKIENPKLEVRITDFEEMSKEAPFFKGDDLFLCLGTTIAKAKSQENFYKIDFGYNYKAAAFASYNKVNQVFLVSSVGADADSRYFYAKVKGQLEDAIRKLDFWAIHIFQPSILLGERNENRFGESVAKRIGGVLNKISGGLLKKYKPVHGEVVAKAMVKSAQLLKQGIFVYASDWIQEMADEEDELRNKINT